MGVSKREPRDSFCARLVYEQLPSGTLCLKRLGRYRDFHAHPARQPAPVKMGYYVAL